MTIRILHLSDIHFGGENQTALAATSDFIRATPFDLMVISGDLTRFGHHDEFHAAAEWLSDLPGPRLSTPGNHDTPWMGLFERFTDPFGRYARSVGPPNADAFQAEGLSVRAFNSARGWQMRPNWSKGHISRAQSRRAVMSFEADPAGALRVMVCHHPLIEIAGGPMTARVRGGRLAAQRLTAAGVDLILTGHLHAPFVQPLPLGDGHTYAIGAGTLSLRERGVPAGFNVIEAEAQSIRVRAMAWDGSALASQNEWVVPLRARPS
jgi:3',5'-cyclic AMP phosphodiesterase CpdA